MTPEQLALDLLRKRFPDDLLEAYTFREASIAVLHKHRIKDVLLFLKEEPDLRFDVLMDLAGVDYLHLRESPRFEVVYQLYSLPHNARLRLKVPVEESDPQVDTATEIWPAANWYEREVWDMFGIRFRGHPDLRRILMYEEFEGHPLRKDYPVDRRQPLIGPVD